MLTIKITYWKFQCDKINIHFHLNIYVPVCEYFQMIFNYLFKNILQTTNFVLNIF